MVVFMWYRNDFHIYIKFLIVEYNVVKTTADQKHESADQTNHSTWLIPYRNELVPPLHDTCGTFARFSSKMKMSIKRDYRNELILEWLVSE